MTQANVSRAGLGAGFAAYLFWGLFPAFLRVIPATPPEIVAHRILWSAPTGALILTLARQWPETRRALLNLRILRVLAVSATLISLNWLLYVWAVAHDRVIEASLGYYVSPLVFVGFGVLFLKEKLSRLQAAAVGLAALAVAALVIGAHVVPWIALCLAATFCGYGLIRKTAPVGAMPGLFIETALLAPLAAAFVAILSVDGRSHFGAGHWRADTLLLLAGPATVAPLALFALAARRLPLTVMGFLQYIGPTLQLALGVYYGERFTPVHAVTFGLIWAALGLASADAVLSARRRRRERVSARPNS